MTTLGDKPDMVDKMIRFEQGDMPVEELVPFVQELVDTGLAWQLQGSYGRLADRYIKAGLVKRPAHVA